MGVGAYEPESVNPSQNLKVSRNLKYIDIEGTKIYDVTIMLQSISPDYFFTTNERMHVRFLKSWQRTHSAVGL